MTNDSSGVTQCGQLDNECTVFGRSSSQSDVPFYALSAKSLYNIRL
jgi:hypothetical protein